MILVINLYVFDDDEIQCDKIGGLIREWVKNRAEFVNEVNVLTLHTKEEVMQKMESGEQIDIFVSDVYLQNESVNGIDIVKKVLSVNPDTQIVYITGYTQYCVDVYETEHVYLLTKPIEKDKLEQALIKAFERLNELDKKTIVIKNAGSIIRIRLNDILYFESDKKKLRIVCKNKTYETYGTIAQMLEQVGEEFVQCHKSWLVNMNYIEELTSKSVIMSNGEDIAVSQKRAKETKSKFIQFVGKI